VKPFLPTVKVLSAVALLCLATGCAGDLKQKENTAAAAGFKIITPAKPDQVALLKTLPKGKVTRTTYQGKTLYVLPDAKNNRAYVGGPAQYQSYAHMREVQKITTENLEAAEMNQMAVDQDWGNWGGWGAVGPVGYDRMGAGYYHPSVGHR